MESGPLSGRHTTSTTGKAGKRGRWCEGHKPKCQARASGAQGRIGVRFIQSIIARGWRANPETGYSGRRVYMLRLGGYWQPTWTPRGHSSHHLFLGPLGGSYAARGLGEISDLHFNMLLRRFCGSVAQQSDITTAQVQACLGVRRWHFSTMSSWTSKLGFGRPESYYLSVQLWHATVFFESWSLSLRN